MLFGETRVQTLSIQALSAVMFLFSINWNHIWLNFD